MSDFKGFCFLGMTGRNDNVFFVPGIDMGGGRYQIQ